MKKRTSIGLFSLVSMLALLLGGCSSSSGDSTTTTPIEKYYFKASNPDTNDEFGFSVALSDDGSTMAVGSRFEQSGDGSDESNNTITAGAGAVYIFVATAGTWQQEEYLKAPAVIDLDGDQFGFSVALSSDGNTLAVGAPYDDQGGDDAGAVYIFTRNAGIWTQQQKVTASNATTGYLFGYSVALSDNGTVLAVGSPFEDTTQTDSGAAYVYRATMGDWSNGVDPEDFLKDATPTQDDFLGVSVALDGDGNVLAAGANQPVATTGPGSVTVFTPTGGAWQGTATTVLLRDTVTATGGENNDQFGVSVALDTTGTVLAVGAIAEDSVLPGDTSDNNASEAGAAYVFVASGGWLGDGSTTIDSEDYIKASTPGINDNFGAAISLSSNGNALAVGALNAGSGVGSVYVFTNGGAWGSGTATENIISPSAGSNGDQFGRVVSLSADATTVAIGANNEDSGATGVDGDETDDIGAPDSGAAYLWIL